MPVLEFDHVHFGYTPDNQTLHDICFRLEEGKIYALVGPTGGGKTTTASLIAGLYKTTKGEIRLFEKPISSYSAHEKSEIIGFILQEPFMFSDTVGNNIRYGNSKLNDTTDAELQKILDSIGLVKLLSTFEDGLSTSISNETESLSLGQKQLIAFSRVILRQPKILILDEATANIDTVTEQILTKIIDSLPLSTTKVVIAHRLNTIKYADQIFFINDGRIKAAQDFEDAVRLVEKG